MGAMIGRLRGLDSRVAYVLQLVAVTAVYTASGKLGLDLAFATRSVTAVWPPTGIALVALILGGYRLWPAIAVGALLTNVNTGVPPETVLGIVCAATRFRFDAFGRAEPHGHTVTNPGADASTPVTFNTTADASAGTPPDPATCNSIVSPAAGCPPEYPTCP